MSRKKKLIRNMVILLLIGTFYYFLGGYYLTKESCIQDNLKSWYSQDNEYITSVKLGSYEVTLQADQDNHTASIICTRKTGPFYQIGDSMIDCAMDKEAPIDMNGMFDHNYGSVVYIYRNDKSIEEIEVILGTGETVIMSDWEKDFILITYDDMDSWMHTICRVYNENHEVVYETAF